MTYSIFTGSGPGRRVDERAATLDCLAGIAQAEPESASEPFLIAQDDDGNTVGETVLASSVSATAQSTTPATIKRMPAAFHRVTSDDVGLAL
jgi:hypothetical protein